MAVIGSLLVNVKANSAGFSSGLAKMRTELVQFRNDLTQGFAGGAFQGFAQGISSAFSAIGAGLSKIPYAGKVLGPLADGFAKVWGAMAPFLQQQAEVIDNVGKLSDRLGVSTENLAGMTHAADLSGVSQEQLVTGLEKFLKTAGDAQAGSASAREAFANLGLSMNDIAGKAPIDALGMVFDRINSLNDVTARASATVAIFGKEGQSLAPVIAEGSAGLRSAALEADKLGLSFSRVDAAKVEAANDALTRLNAAFAGFFRTVVIQMAPFVEAGIAAVSDLIQEMGGVKPIAQGIVSAVKFVGVGFAAAFDAALFPIRAVVLQLDLVGKAIDAIKTGDFAGFGADVMKLTDPKELLKQFAPAAAGLNDFFAKLEAQANAAGEEVARKGLERRGVLGQPALADKQQKDDRNLAAAIKGSVEAAKAIASAERRQAELEAANRPIVDAVGKVEKAVQTVADRLAKVIGLQEDIAVVEL